MEKTSSGSLSRAMSSGRAALVSTARLPGALRFQMESCCSKLRNPLRMARSNPAARAAALNSRYGATASRCRRAPSRSASAGEQRWASDWPTTLAAVAPGAFTLAKVSAGCRGVNARGPNQFGPHPVGGIPVGAPEGRTVGHAELPPLSPSRYVMAMSVAVPRYTLEDLESFPDDGNRYELVDGILLVTPAPIDRK